MSFPQIPQILNILSCLLCHCLCVCFSSSVLSLCHLIHRSNLNFASCSTNVLESIRNNLFSGRGPSLGLHVAFVFIFWVSFDLWQSFSLSLSFMTLTFLKSTGHLFYRMALTGACLMFVHCEIQVLHFCQEDTEVMLCPSQPAIFFWLEPSAKLCT